MSAYQPHASATEALAALQPRGSVFVLTNGRFSLLDLLVAALDKVGPADVRVSTWSAGIRDAEVVAALQAQDRIRSVRLYVDKSMHRVNESNATTLVDLFGAEALRVCFVHAKMVALRAGDWRIVIRSSMNLNRNPRFEQADIDDDPDLFGCVWAWFDEVDKHAVVGAECTDAQAGAALRAVAGGAPETTPPDLTPASEEAGILARLAARKIEWRT